MKKQILLLTSVFAISAINTGCARSKSADLMAPPVVYKADGTVADGIEFTFNPQVDILFVIDNSDSMLGEQANLSLAANNFVENFGENNLVDYRLGIISVYDSVRCGQPDKKTGEIIGCYPKGQLQPLKSAAPLATPFVTRFDGAKDVIRESLKIGTVPLEKGGPRFEDFFTPILTAIEPSQNKLNGDFLRPNAKLVIVVVTDEDDNNANISVDSFIQQLDMQIGRENYDFYAVVTNKMTTADQAKACGRQSYADAPERLTEVAKKTHGKVLEVCDSSFGSKLANIGSEIRKKMISKEIVLPSVPQQGTLILKYGGKPIPYGAGWTYDPRRQSIKINENIKIDFDSKSQFQVDYVRMEEVNLRKTHTAVQ
jgi:hypothetical protein